MKAKPFFPSLLSIKFLLPFSFLVALIFSMSYIWAACGSDIECYDQKITGTSGTAHTWGSFSTEGNAGIINFDSGNVILTRGYNGADIQYLSGWLWSETVGWMHFDPSINALTSLQIADTSSNIRAANTLSGWLWSENAGWIQMNPPYVGGGVVFDTTNGPALNGWGYSQNLGWIPFGSGVVAKTLGNALVGRVKVIGNLSGNNIFDVLYNIGTSFVGQNTANTLNTIKKNIALATRRMDINTDTNRVPTNNILYYKPTISLVKYSDINNGTNEYFSKQSRTLIIEGADLVIDADVIPSFAGGAVNGPKAIIVLADKDGNYGNIIIKGNVKKIGTTLIAEKSILSGLSPNILYNDTKENVLSTLPPYQLYIKGSIVSYNTIGGSSNDQSAFRCPYFDNAGCNGTTALKYDFNYFRNFQSGSTDVDNERAIPGYDDYSMIIEFDPKALSDPPPGLSF